MQFKVISCKDQIKGTIKKKRRRREKKYASQSFILFATRFKDAAKKGECSAECMTQKPR